MFQALPTRASAASLNCECLLKFWHARKCSWIGIRTLFLAFLSLFCSFSSPGLFIKQICFSCWLMALCEADVYVVKEGIWLYSLLVSQLTCLEAASSHPEKGWAVWLQEELSIIFPVSDARAVWLLAAADFFFFFIWVQQLQSPSRCSSCCFSDPDVRERL